MQKIAEKGQVVIEGTITVLERLRRKEKRKKDGKGDGVRMRENEVWM